MIGRWFAAAIAVVALALSTTTTLPAEAQERFTVKVAGDKGTDVVLIPGLSSSAAVWDATVAQLSGTHRVHVLQVRGFAGEPAGANAEGPVLRPLVDEVAAYAAKLGKPAIIGHSLGGLVALEVAAQKPAAVDRLMIVDALPFYALTMSPMATSEMVKPQATMMRTQMIAMPAPQFAAMQGQTMAILAKSETGRAAALDWSLKSDRRVMAQAMYEDMVEDARALLPAITAKTTVIYHWDAAMPTSAAQEDANYAAAYAGLANAKLKRIDGGYHYIMLDQPKAFAGHVAEFLN